MEHLLKLMHGLMKCMFVFQPLQMSEQLEQPMKVVQSEHFQFQEDRYENLQKYGTKLLIKIFTG